MEWHLGRPLDPLFDIPDNLRPEAAGILQNGDPSPKACRGKKCFRDQSE